MKGAGSLRHEIQLQRLTRSTDAGGGGPGTWTTITNGTVWAEIMPVGGRERFAADQVQTRVSHKIRIRHHSGATPPAGLRVKHGTRQFDVLNTINWSERERWLLLECEERVTEGAA